METGTLKSKLEPNMAQKDPLAKGPVPINLVICVVKGDNVNMLLGEPKVIVRWVGEPDN